MPAGTNPFAIGEQLAGMSDQQLMQLAQMHSDDAIMMSALMSEKQRRQHMQGATQAQGPQPTVRDQIMQSMAPADTGVAQLPVASQGYADGGVVGYAGGGDTAVRKMAPQYPVGATPTGEPEWRGAQERADAEYWKSLGLNVGAAAADVLTLPLRGAAQVTEQAVTRPLRAMGVPLPYFPNWLYGNDRTSVTPYMDMVRRTRSAPPASAAVTPEEKAREAAKLRGAEEASRNITPKYATPDRKVDAGAGAGARASVSSRTPGTAGLAAVTKPNFGSDEEYLDPIRQYQQSMEARINAERELRKQGQPGGEAYAGLEAALKKEEAEEPGKRNDAKGLAILTAGLSIMGGTSPYALANFKEATAGIAQYRDSIKDIERSAKERMKAKADIEQARRAEATGNWRDQQGFEERATGRMEQAQTLGVNAIVGLTKVKREEAKDIYLKGIELAQRKYEADLQASTQRATAGIYAGARAGAGGPDVKILIAQHGKLSDRIKKLQGDLTGGKLYNPKDKQAAQEELAVLKGQLQSVTEMMRAHGGANIEETPAVPGGPDWHFKAK